MSGRIWGRVIHNWEKKLHPVGFALPFNSTVSAHGWGSVLMLGFRHKVRLKVEHVAAAALGTTVLVLSADDGRFWVARLDRNDDLPEVGDTFSVPLKDGDFDWAGAWITAV